MKYLVEEYMNQLENLGKILMEAISVSLLLNKNYFTNHFKNPTTLFRIFNYPPHNNIYGENSFGVGEHTDYGFITILYQDNHGGLEIKDIKSNTFIPAPPINNSFVINLGDALEHMTGGLLLATPHRVRKRINETEDRISLPFFYDPSFDTEMISLVDQLSSEDLLIAEENKKYLNNSDNKNNNKTDTGLYSRWDKQDITKFNGTYGSYLLKKVEKVFPDLAAENL